MMVGYVDRQSCSRKRRPRLPTETHTRSDQGNQEIESKRVLKMQRAAFPFANITPTRSFAVSTRCSYLRIGR